MKNSENLACILLRITSIGTSNMSVSAKDIFMEFSNYNS